MEDAKEWRRMWKKFKEKRISRQPNAIQIMVDKKQQGNVEHFNCVDSTITNDARCAWEIKSRIAMKEAAFNKKKILFTIKLDLNIRKKPVNATF